MTFSLKTHRLESLKIFSWKLTSFPWKLTFPFKANRLKTLKMFPWKLANFPLITRKFSFSKFSTFSIRSSDLFHWKLRKFRLRVHDSWIFLGCLKIAFERFNLHQLKKSLYTKPSANFSTRTKFHSIAPPFPSHIVFTDLHLSLLFYTKIYNSCPYHHPLDVYTFANIKHWHIPTMRHRQTKNFQRQQNLQTNIRMFFRWWQICRHKHPRWTASIAFHGSRSKAPRKNRQKGRSQNEMINSQKLSSSHIEKGPFRFSLFFEHFCSYSGNFSLELFTCHHHCIHPFCIHSASSLVSLTACRQCITIFDLSSSKNVNIKCCKE